MRTVISVVGARPNFMKAAPVRGALEKIGSIRHLLLHTGQHYDPNMSDVFFRDLDMAPPDLYLGIGSGSHAEQTARIMTAFEEICLKERPDLVIVYGDVNSTVAAALVAKKLWIPVAHVESGLRSFDRKMPEEVNRVLTDAICDLLFVTEESGRVNLMREGIDPRSIHFVGNTMIDSLARFVKTIPDRASNEQYFVLTLHRPSNVDDAENLGRLLTAIRDGAEDMPVVFPVHPRTAKIMQENGLYAPLVGDSRWRLTEPAGYREFIGMIRDAAGVITDSGGIQEETTWLGVPCVTLRESTERPSTVELGTNRLVGVDTEMVRSAVASIRLNPVERYAVPPLWDGRAAERIARVVMSFLAEAR